MKNILNIIILFILTNITIKSDWVQVSNGITQLNINDLTTTGNYIFAATNVTVSGGGVFRSSNNGNSWEQVYFTTTLSLASFDSFVYRGYQNGFSYSSNYGSNWITPGGASRWITALLANANYVYSGCFTPTVTTNRGVWITSNNGMNWQQTSLNNVNIYSLTKSNDFLFAGGNGLFVSTDNGNSWTLSLSTTVWALSSIGSKIYAGIDGSPYGIYKSTNYGINWVLTSLNVGTHAILSNSNYIIAGSGNGIYVSIDDGNSWIYRNEGMGPYWINSLAIINNYLFAGTDGNGVWRRPLSEVVSIKTISTSIPLKYELFQNYPNPFNPITNIKFNIPKESYIQIIIYDILGREKEKLVNQELNASAYEIDFNGMNYSSGVYFYQLVSNGKNIDTKKFIISK